MPEGWIATRSRRVAPSTPDESRSTVRFRRGEPPIGGYSLRVKAIDNHKTPADEVFDKKLPACSGLRRRGRRSSETDDAVYFTLPRRDDNRLRYNFFRWFACDDDLDAARLEMSRRRPRVQDEQGLRALLDQVRPSQAAPIG